MFDTVKIGKKIKEARLERNLTQMNLADAMGVSYQAVSNWERGNSMPDIGKLEELCKALGIGVEELLGIENPETKTVSKVMSGGGDLSLEEIAEVAPVLQPEKIKEETAKVKRRKADLSVLADMAPFLDDEHLEELLEECDFETMEGFDDLAPFLSTETLDRIVQKAQPKDVEALLDAAPFLSKEALEHLVDIAGEDSLEGLADSAAFLGDEALEKLARRCIEMGCGDAVSDLVPFFSKEALGKIVDLKMERGELDDLSDFYPFLDRETAKKLAKRLIQEGNLDALEDLAMFM